MSYQVHITSTAEHDIMRAADYIEFTLKNPDAADNLLDAATEQISSLADLPQKFRLVDDPVLASWGIRFVIINNYLAFYTIDEEKQTVIIVRFLYQKSNWTSILRQGFSLISGICFYAGSFLVHCFISSHTRYRQHKHGCQSKHHVSCLFLHFFKFLPFLYC